MAQDEEKTIDQLNEEADIAADYLEGLLDIVDYEGDIEMGVRNNRLNRVIGTTWIISAARRGIRGNMTLVPANGTNHPISVTTGVHYRRTALRFTASKHAAICCSNDRKSACAALGLARNTISQDSGKADSYFRASTRKRRLTALRVTALPTALETAKPTRRPRIAAESSIMASSCTK